MKVLIIPSWYPHRENRTQGIFFLKQAELLSRHHEVRILVGRGNAVGYRKTPQNILSLLGAGYEACDFFLDELPAVKMYQFGYDDFVFLPEEKRLNRIGSIYEKYFVKEIAPGWKPDTIHAHDVIYGGVAALKISEANQVPFVITSHTPFQPAQWNLGKAEWFRRIFAAASQVLAVSRFDRDSLAIALGSDTAPVTVGNYIDDGVFKPAPRKKNECFEFLYVASTSTRKDFPTLFSALKFVKEGTQMPFFLNLPILEVNDGITMEEINALISVNGLEEQVKIHQNMSIENGLLGMYQKADLFISSSYHETFGVATAEAISCGTPVIAVDNGGIRDIVEDGVNGVLTPKQRPDILAANILGFMNGEFKFDKAVLHQSVAGKFGAEVFLKKLDSIYEKVLNDQRN